MAWHEGWVCESCTYVNEGPTEPACEICQHAAPGASFPNQRPNSKDISCDINQLRQAKRSRISPPRRKSYSVETINLDSDESDYERQRSAPATTSLQSEHWICQYCSVANTPDLLYCHVCCGTSSSKDTAVKAANLGAENTVPFRSVKELKCDDIEVVDLELSDEEPVKTSSKQARAGYHHPPAIPRKEHSTKVSGSQQKPVNNASILSRSGAKKKAALNKSRMLGVYFWSEVTVHIPEAVWTKYSPFIRESVQVLRGDINAFSVSDRTNWITWERKQCDDLLEPECFDKINSRLM